MVKIYKFSLTGKWHLNPKCTGMVVTREVDTTYGLFDMLDDEKVCKNCGIVNGRV